MDEREAERRTRHSKMEWVRDEAQVTTEEGAKRPGSKPTLR